MKLRHISAVAVLAVFLPLAASALTSNDIQQQIQSLLAQIAQLQAQLKQLQIPTPVQPPPDIAPTPPSCPILNRTLAQGATGDDVTQLQQYLGVEQSGYFGSATAKAVASLQADAGLSQVGIVGPATRAWIYRRCGGGGWNQNFTASPTSGAAPLTVSFSTRIPQERTDGTYSVDFGDGSTGDMSVAWLGMACIQGSPCYRGIGTVSHTYISNGTYTAKLTYQPSYSCPPGAYCPAMMPAPRTIGTVTIYVGGSSGTGAPVINGIDGPASLAVGQTGTWTVHATIGNSANTNLRYSVIWGDEPTFSQIQAFGASAPQAISASGTFTHAYWSEGTYKPTFTVSNNAGSAQTSASVVVGGSTSNGETFSASPQSGAAPLNVSFKAENTDSNASYSVRFGDGASANMAPGPMPMSMMPCSLEVGCPVWKPYLAAYHTYTSGGTYTAKLIRTVWNPAMDCNVPANIPDWIGCGSTVVGTITINVSPAPVNAGYLRVTPTYGQQPLTVTVSTSNLPQGASLDFGDPKMGGGAACALSGVSVASGGSNTVQQWTTPVQCDFTGQTHTYYGAGTYVVSVSGQNGVLDTVTVTVTTPSYPPQTNWFNSGTLQGTPPSGAQTSASSVPSAGGSCSYNGQTYANGALISAGSTSAACQNIIGCGASATYLVCDNGVTRLTVSAPTSAPSSAGTLH